MNALDVLEQLEQTSGSNAKIEILKANKDNKELVELLDAALNFQRKFYLKKADFFQISTFSFSEEKRFQLFLQLLNKLQKREVTGHAAISEVEQFFAYCSGSEQKWYSRVLLKDLKCNFGISSCVKAGIYIPEFEVMLAKDGKECKKIEDIISKGVYLSPKFDGYRCLAVCVNGDVTLYSRNGVEYENFPTIGSTLEQLCTHSSFVLDGEIMSDDFNAMQQTAFSSKSNKTVGDVKYHVFGMIPYEEWQAQEFKMVTSERLNRLATWFSVYNSSVAGKQQDIVQVKQTLVADLSSVLAYERECIAKGYEGAMVLPNIPYYLGKKSNRLMKFKTMQSQDCKVVGIYEGEPGSKYVGAMGGMNVIQENGLPCNVGSGFTDDDRTYIFTNPESAVGRIAEIKFQDLTPDGIMRFPVFMRWRDDK